MIQFFTSVPNGTSGCRLEALYSNKKENSVNERVEFPRVYLNLKNF